MNESTIWWLIAGSLVGIELMTGTFYLLMLAIGATAGAIAAHAQLGFTTQLITGSVDWPLFCGAFIPCKN